MTLPLIFTKSQSGLNDNKEPENMKYTRLKYGEKREGERETEIWKL